MPASSLDATPTLSMRIQFAVRATQSAPHNEDQVVVPHPLATGLHVVAWFPFDDELSPGSQNWPPQSEYRYKATQLVANLVAMAELDAFGSAIPTIIP